MTQRKGLAWPEHGRLDQVCQLDYRGQPPAFAATDRLIDAIAGCSGQGACGGLWSLFPHQPRLAVQDRLVVKISQQREPLCGGNDIAPGFQVGLPNGVIN